MKPADVLGPVLRQGWDAFVLVHTHPCGGPASAADHAVTRRLVAACAVVGVRLETHLVLTTTGTYVVSGQVRSTGARLAA
ncbi:MAG: JAB domain-containing protein [Mycobacteriales bacterium]